MAFLVTREDLVIQDFDVAPGGSWLVYRTADRIATTSVDGQQGQTIVQNATLTEGTRITQMGDTVTWSPDAGKLAYITNDGFQILAPGADEDFEPLIFGVTETPLFRLNWSPDGSWLLAQRIDGTAALYGVNPLQRWVELGGINAHVWLVDGRLAFAPSEGGLALLTPGDVNSRQFIMPQDRQISLITQRGDGKLAYYVHSGSVEEPGFLHTANPADLSFSIENNVGVSTRDKRWNPAGTRLVGPGKDPGLVTVIDVETGGQASFAAGGEVIGFEWGDLPALSVSGVSLPGDLYYLAPQAGVTQVWRLPASGDTPRAVTSAAQDILAFDVSADGTQLVYTSAQTIYRLVLNSLDLTEVATLSADAVGTSGTPALGAGGRLVAYADGGIHVVNLDTGQDQRVLRDTLPQPNAVRQVQIFDQPRWSPDGQWLLVWVTFYEGSDLALLRLPGEDGILHDPVFLDLFGADARWTPEGRLYAYRDGSTYGLPFVTLIEPGNPPNMARLLESPVTDAQPRSDGRVALVQAPTPGIAGPTVVRVYSMTATGSDLTPETGSLVLENAQLSPDGMYLAGLIQAHLDASGVAIGKIAIVNTQTGEVRAIESTADASHLQWTR